MQILFAIRTHLGVTCHLPSGLEAQMTGFRG
jgi:hypothetical protein